MSVSDPDSVDHIVADAGRAAERRDQGCRERALKLYPWICGRCASEFTRTNVRELTVHHRDRDHDNNPPDGSNRELLCLHCHDNEHQRLVEATGASIASLDLSAELATRHTQRGTCHDPKHRRHYQDQGRQ